MHSVHVSHEEDNTLLSHKSEGGWEPNGHDRSRKCYRELLNFASQGDILSRELLVFQKQIHLDHCLYIYTVLHLLPCESNS